jgi:hypothetical protein
MVIKKGETMIKLPDFEKSFEYENNFYLSCDNTRLSKILAHYEFYKMIKNLPGAIVDCGIFKGTSLVRFAGFRDLFGNAYSHKIIGFDTFDDFPETSFEEDKKFRERFIANAGGKSITMEQLNEVLELKNINQNIELVKGDITETVPEYVENHPYLKIALLNLDTDIYEPAVTILEYLYPKIVKGGILLMDDYGEFPGETKAIDDFFSDKNVTIKKSPFAMTPCYIKKL